MIRRTLGFLSLSLLIAAGFYFAFASGPVRPLVEKAFIPQVPMLSALSLEGEKSPYFSRQSVQLADGGREEISCYRSDKSVAHLFFNKDNRLERVEAYRQDETGRHLVYTGNYDPTGRRITRASYFDAQGRVETSIERAADGTQTHKFYRASVLIRETTLAADGTQTTRDIENKSETTVQASVETKDLVFWDAEKKKTRLRVSTRAARLSTWEYFKDDGSLEHSGKVLADESLEYSYFEAGKLKRRQVWSLVGEDWERAYYGLSYSEAFADDGKAVEHKVWVRSNGSLKRHERYNAKSGKLEMERDFDEEGRVARVEDYTEKGESKQIWVFPRMGVRSRGFVPTGMRSYPGGDEKIGYVYNLDGQPFSHSVLDPHPWALFEQAGKN